MGLGGVFAGTPLRDGAAGFTEACGGGRADTCCPRYGYYRNGIDGEFGAGTAAAVRSFQARSGLVADGRLNMETLSALGLLPGPASTARSARGAPCRAGQFIAGSGFRVKSRTRSGVFVRTSAPRISPTADRRKRSRRKPAPRSAATAGRDRRRARRSPGGIFCAARARAACSPC